MINDFKNTEKSIKKAIFLDRDGTLNVDYGYIYQPEKIHLIEGAKDAINIFQEQEYLLFLFTNQPGIERGIYKRQDVENCHAKLFELLGGNFFTEICIAEESNFSHENYRKPSPKFINEIVGKYNIDTSKSYMVGDKETDAFAGINGGVRSVLLDSNYNRSENCMKLIKENYILTFCDLISFAKSLQN